MNVKHFESPNSLAQAGADRFVLESVNAIKERGRFLVALSGGSTPKQMYRLLRTTSVEWPKVYVFWSDDRFVPPASPESNEGMARRELLDFVPIPADQIFGMYGPGTPDERAAAYERSIIACGGTLDLTLLGIGPDGHTASLFPGDPAIVESTRLVVKSKAPVGIRERITFTIPLIAASRCALWLIAGTDKQATWQRIEHGEALPTRIAIDASRAADVYLSI